MSHSGMVETPRPPIESGAGFRPRENLSLPRKREPRVFDWIPVFTGMTTVETSHPQCRFSKSASSRQARTARLQGQGCLVRKPPSLGAFIFQAVQLECVRCIQAKEEYTSIATRKLSAREVTMRKVMISTVLTALTGKNTQGVTFTPDGKYILV